MSPPAAPSPKEALAEARRRLNAGDHAGAAQIAMNALVRRKRDPDLLAVLGAALTRAGRARDALPYLERSLEVRPVHPATILDLANAHRHLGQTDKAFELLDRALMYEPGYAAALYGKAMLLQTVGEHRQALDLVAPHATKAAADPRVVTAYASLCRQLADPEDAVRALEGVFSRANLPPAHERPARFEMGHALDALARYDEAFEHFKRGNELTPPRPEGDPEKLISVWSKDTLSRLVRAQERSELPVLVVGMPRSGTSLCEQVVCRHPQAEGVGESRLLGQLAAASPPASLTQQRVDAMGRQYLDMLRAATTPRTTRVLDKMPGNTMTLGLASRIIPGARVVWRRRDPRDTILSCYFQDFGANLTFTRDLESCARHLVAQERLMRHWQETLDLPILEDRYEEFVSDPEGSIRRLLDFLGLPFDEACLSFHESRRRMDTASMGQVRRPLFDTSVGRWRHYEAQLAPAIRVLEDASGGAKAG
ncbi:MAG: sulfotransferase [Phycisphaerales bacterium]